MKRETDLVDRHVDDDVDEDDDLLLVRAERIALLAGRGHEEHTQMRGAHHLDCGLALSAAQHFCNNNNHL